MIDQNKSLRLGTRGSLLARMQSEGIARRVRDLRPGLIVNIVVIKTTGDRIQDKPLHDVGGKGLFTKELEQALIAGEIDFAVHSYKDVPVTMPLVETTLLTIAAVPAREDARDVLVTRDGCSKIIELPSGACVGTGSLRRRCQLLCIRADLHVMPVRGNIDTRLRKLRAGEMDAVILAAAGLKRAELFDATTMVPIDLDEMVPSPGQGALALQCRLNDANTSAILKELDHPATAVCVNLERELVKLLQADCHSPVGIHARIDGGTLRLTASIGGHDDNPPLIVATVQSRLSETDRLADKLFIELSERGAMAALHPTK